MKRNIDNLQENECILVLNKKQLDRIMLYSHENEANWLRYENITRPILIFRGFDFFALSYTINTLMLSDKPMYIYPAKDFYAKKPKEKKDIIGDFSGWGWRNRTRRNTGDLSNLSHTY